MYIFLEFVIIFLIYLIIVPLVYYWTEVKHMPEWLDFKPWNCRKCFTFWSLMGISIILGLSFNAYWLMGTGIVLAILTAIAMTIDQRNKTIKIE